VNSVGEPDARNGHVRFDERGWETERFTRHRAHPRLYQSQDRAFPHGSKKLKTRGIAGKLAIRHEQAAFQRGESAARLTLQLLRRLDDYGVAEFTAALREALEQQTPRLSAVAFILARRHRQRRQPTPLAVHLARRPDLENLTVSIPSLEAYEDLTQDPQEDPDADE
jgi:hypothetical protein